MFTQPQQLLVPDAPDAIFVCEEAVNLLQSLDASGYLLDTDHFSDEQVREAKSAWATANRALQSIREELCALYADDWMLIGCLDFDHDRIPALRAAMSINQQTRLLQLVRDGKAAIERTWAILAQSPDDAVRDVVREMAEDGFFCLPA